MFTKTSSIFTTTEKVIVWSYGWIKQLMRVVPLKNEPEKCGEGENSDSDSDGQVKPDQMLRAILKLVHAAVNFLATLVSLEEDDATW